MMCRDFRWGLISEKGDRREEKTKRARMQEPAENDLEWGSVVGRKFLQQCLPPDPHCLLTSSLRGKVMF